MRERPSTPAISEEQVSQHFIATLEQLERAFDLATDKDRDEALEAVVQFLPLFQKKVRALRDMLTLVKDLKKQKEWKNIHRNAYHFFEMLEHESARQLLADMFLARYVQHCKGRRKKDRKPADVFGQILSESGITPAELPKIGIKELLKDILLTGVIENSLPPEYKLANVKARR